MNIINLFPTAIIKEKLEISSDEIDFMESRKFIRVNNDNGFISNSTKLLDYDELVSLKDKVQQHIEIVCHEIYLLEKTQKIYITTSWANIHEKNDFAQQHKHSNSFLSAILFVKIPPNSGKINFFNSVPNLGTSLEFKLTKMNTFNSNYVSFAPEAGDLYIFPSSLQHSVDKSSSDQTRITLALNTFIKGSLGSHETALDI